MQQQRVLFLRLEIACQFVPSAPEESVSLAERGQRRTRRLRGSKPAYASYNMSKKTSLSASGSLAACLHFAAQVLSPRAKDTPAVPETLTKEVLAPIVVDAHRFGLQITRATMDGRVELNPRKLLHLCRDIGDETARGSMTGIAIADVTWDFQGSVADTLDMAFEDLLQRARAGRHAICALFSISATEDTAGNEEYALVWVPAEEDAPEQVPKHSMLFYACPGRVKVVKSVGDLVYKMREEIKSTRNGCASFCVWTVVAAAKADLRLSEELRRVSLAPPTDDSKGKKSVTRSGDIGSMLLQSTGAVTTPAPSVHAANNRIDRTEEISSQDVQLTPCVPNSTSKQPSRPQSSIFRFSSVVTSSIRAGGSESVNMSYSMPHRGGADTTRSDGETMGSNNNEECAPEVEHEASSSTEVTPSGNQHEDIRLGSSLAGGYSTPRTPSARSSLTRTDWSVSHAHIPVSRSSVIKRRQSPQEPISRLSRSVDSRGVTSDLQGLRGSYRDQDDLLQTSPRIRFSRSRESRASIDKATDLAECGHSRVPERVLVATNVQAVVKTPPTQSIFAFNTESSDDNEQRSSQRIEADHDDDKHEQPHVYGQPEGVGIGSVFVSVRSPSACKVPAKASSPVNQSSKLDDTSVLSGVDQALLAPEYQHQETPKKSARDRVRSQLGARAWWELEYTARRLEQEAALEQPRPLQWSVDGGLRCTTRINSRRQLPEPMLTSKVDRNASFHCAGRLGSETLADSTMKGTVEEHPSMDSMRRLEQQEHSVVVCNAESDTLRTGYRRAMLSPTRKLLTTAVEPLKTQLASPKNKSTHLSPFDCSNDLFSPVQHSAGVGCFTTRSDLRTTDTARPSRDAALGRSLSSSQHPQDCQSSAQGEHVWALGYGREVPSKLSARQRAVENKREQEQEQEQEQHTTWNGEQQRAAESDEDGGEECQEVAPFDSTRRRSSHEIRLRASVLPVHEAEQTRVAAASESPASETTTVPFHLSGRVPIRSQPRHGTLKARRDNPNSGDASPTRDHSGASSIEKTGLPTEQSTPRAASGPPLQLCRPPAAAAVATFIAFDDSDGAMSAGKKEAAARMDRLNELRQKKLEQLHKARELTLAQQQQQHDKRRKRVEKKPADADCELAPPVAPPAALPGVQAPPSQPQVQLRVKRASNRQQMQNALEFTLLAGQSNARERLAALEALAQSPAESFVVLLKSARELKFRALYESHPGVPGEARRIYSVVSSAHAPPRLAAANVAQFFKYSSAKKQLLPVDTRCFTVATDACALAEQLVFKRAAAKPRPL